jgi:hypothetical protein
MFGHTFLVFHDEETPEVSAMTLEFIGLTEDRASPLTDALVGSLPGRFRFGCYFQKRWEYDQEDRDLWIYRLRLDDSERRALEKEAQSLTAVNYGFVHHNCAFRVHELLLRSYGVSPGSTPVHVPISGIRELGRMGKLIEPPVLVPSSWRMFRSAYDPLVDQQRLDFKRGIIEEGSTAADPAVATALSRYVNYQVRREADAEKRVSLFRLKQKVLDTQGAFAGVVPDPRAEQGLSVIRLEGFGAGGPDLRLSWIPGVRAPWDQAVGATRSTRLEYGRIGVDLYRKAPRLSAVRIFEMDGLIPTNEFMPGFGRLFEVGYADSTIELDRQSRRFDVRFGFGLAAGPTGWLDISLMPLVDAGFYKLEKGVHFSGDLGLRLRVVSWLSHRTHFNLTGESLFVSARGYRQKLEGLLQHSLNDSWALGLGAMSYPSLAENFSVSLSRRF